MPTTDSYPIDPAESIAQSVGQDTDTILATVAQRYIGDAPRRPPTYRATPEAGCLVDSDGKVQLDFADRFPDSDGSVAYAGGRVPPGTAEIPALEVDPGGPVRIVVNGEAVLEGDTRHQSGREGPLSLELPLTDDWDDVVIECRRTPAGFGVTIEPPIRWFPLRVLAPTPERAGQAGWVYTAPLSAPLSTIPDSQDAWVEADVEWQPAGAANHSREFKPITGDGPGRMVAWSTVVGDQGACTLSLSHDEPVTVFLDAETVYEAESGSGTLDLDPAGDRADLVVDYDSTDADCRIEVTSGDAAATLDIPHPVAGTESPWLHAGPVETVDPGAVSIGGLLEHSVGDSGDGLPNVEEATHWRCGPDTWVRAHGEDGPYGTWSYPVGVTLYGLLETGRSLERSDISGYVRDHLRQCTTLYPYLQWDHEHFGLPAVHEQWAICSMLDHCGSMGATILEAAVDFELPWCDAVTESIAEFVRHGEDRLDDGTLYRRTSDMAFMNDTLWADDLYMSTPFLARYAERTGEQAHLDDAIAQFERFEHYLGMAEPTVLSHVYDGRHDAATGIPWGRGNGWALFSMAETLDRTPADHPERAALLDRFQRFAAGYRSLQSDGGFWHQILTDPEAYLETSCTAMFTWAFARGVRRGWLPADPYAGAAMDGWAALTRGAIDAQGNVHGVCHGSSYSFSPEYYTEDLGTVTNDLHGIGIVLLAGVETKRLRSQLS